jgi:hypothetical protein
MGAFASRAQPSRPSRRWQPIFQSPRPAFGTNVGDFGGDFLPIGGELRLSNETSECGWFLPADFSLAFMRLFEYFFKLVVLLKLTK